MPAVTISTVGDHIDHAHYISFSCQTRGCLEHGPIDLEAFADYVGRDFVCNARTLAPFFECRKCGGKDVGFIVSCMDGRVGVVTPSPRSDLAAEMKKEPPQPKGQGGRQQADRVTE